MLLKYNTDGVLTKSRQSSPGNRSRRYFGISVLLLVIGCGGGDSGGREQVDAGRLITADVAVNGGGSFDDVSDLINSNSVGADESIISVITPEDTTLSLILAAADDSALLEISSFPRSGAAVLIDGVLEYTPNLDFFGNDSLRVTHNSREHTIELIVSPVNDAPVIVGDIDRVAEQGVLFNTQLRVRNVDRDRLKFSSSNLPAWLSLDAQTGELSGTPTQQDVGLDENIDFIVRDEGGLEDALTGVAIEVLDLNDAPTLNTSQFPRYLDGREEIQVNVFPDDLDGDSVRLVVEPNDFVTTEVSGGSVRVSASDVLEVTQINLVLGATDERGNLTREIVPLTLFPLTETGAGRTLQGKRVGSGLHLVVLGDGYREDQLPQFRIDVENLVATMTEDPAVDLHLSAWNIHMIETASVDSGIDDDVSVDIRDTVFDTGYFCLALPRLICGNNNTMFNVALDEYPDLDQLVLLVNDARYGGSGGSVSIASSSAPEIALHEMGHSLAGLADEYVDNTFPSLGFKEFDEGAYPNVSSLQDPMQVPWSRWIDLNNTIPSEPGASGVGIFKGAFYDAQAFNRPTFDSRMRTFNKPFGPVNGEAWALSVYQETNPVATFFPRTNTLSINTGDTVVFRVEPVFGPDIQRVSWALDGQLLTESTNNTELELLLDRGEHTLTLSVNDITGAIRQSGPHAGQFLWRWDISVL